MYLVKCDLCKRIVKDATLEVRVTMPKFHYGSFAFCEKCGKQFLSFLKKKRLLTQREQLKVR